MPHVFRTIAIFNSADEALEAKARLEEAGLPVSLDVDAMAGWSWHDPRTVSLLRFSVPADEADRARELLARWQRETAIAPPSGPAQPEESWPCPKCATDVEPFLDVCWACGTTRDGVEDPQFEPAGAAVDEPPQAQPGLAGQTLLPATARESGPADVRRRRLEAVRREPDFSAGFGFPAAPDLDAILLRAWRTSVLGMLFFPPLLTLYSTWLVLKCFVLSDGVRRPGQWRLYLALAVNLVVLLVAGYVLHANLARQPAGSGPAPPAAARAAEG